jgi:predicted RNase H-like HicB family nuclease
MLNRSSLEKRNEGHHWREELMEARRFTYDQEDEMFIGRLEDYPDPRTQGETLEELKENLGELYQELNRGTHQIVEVLNGH